MQLKDKVVVVTGGASGIGKSLCERFAKEGASAVVVSDINAEGTKVVADSISGQTESMAIVTDVSKEDQVSALVESTIDKFGHIDLFCSNAGIFTVGG